MQRALLSLDGLSVGDALGNCYSTGSLKGRELPPVPWRYTDDTEMALGIVEVLQWHARIDQDELAAVFTRRYLAEPDRGYGPNVMTICRAIHGGVPWKTAATTLLSSERPRGILSRLKSLLGRPEPGKGSFGNGGAMRVAPVGGYFADDMARVVSEASASSEVTHAHPDGIAGAVAVAAAAAGAWRIRTGQLKRSPLALLEFALEHTPPGPTREKMERALTLPADMTAWQAAQVLGNGEPITSAETVPFALWCAGQHLDDYAEALWTAVSVGGDMDTLCAIVGGIVALAVGAVPAEWLEAREGLSLPTMG
jgi:ADP-ribosylglycohydrolase